VVCSDFLSRNIIKEWGCFARQKTLSHRLSQTIPGQKAPRTRRHKGRVRGKEVITDRIKLFNLASGVHTEF